jgi:oligopeptide transport system substrate-binding protein
LRSWRRFDRLVVERNPRYYDAAVLALDHITFLPVVEWPVVLSLYRSGFADSMSGERLSTMSRPALRQTRDFHEAQAFSVTYPAFNTRRPPFDNVVVRYAFAMATDKRALARFAGAAGPVTSLVPVLPAYRGVRSLFVDISGRRCDVLSYDPQTARELLASAAVLSSPVEYLFPALPDCRERAEMIQQQWRETLGVQVTLTTQDVKSWLASVFSQEFKGIAEYGGWGDYIDPNTYLEYFVSGSGQNPSGWTNPDYDRMLADANRETDGLTRMERLKECEELLLAAMPVIPLHQDTWAYLQKPYVRGITSNLLDVHPFKYAWIDTEWRSA